MQHASCNNMRYNCVKIAQKSSTRNSSNSNNSNLAPSPLSNAHEIWIQIELKHHKRPSRSALAPTVTLHLPLSLPACFSFSPCRLANFVTLNKHLVNNDMQKKRNKNALTSRHRKCISSSSSRAGFRCSFCCSSSRNPPKNKKKNKIRSTFSLDNNFYC